MLEEDQNKNFPFFYGGYGASEDDKDEVFSGQDGDGAEATKVAGIMSNDNAGGEVKETVGFDDKNNFLADDVVLEDENSKDVGTRHCLVLEDENSKDVGTRHCLVLEDENIKDVGTRHCLVQNVVSEDGLGAGKTAVILKILENIAEEIGEIRKLLPKKVGQDIKELSVSPEAALGVSPEAEGNIVEGVFDGAGMIGSDGKHYDIPPNYASKSKLVEGDILKLTINPDGSFLFKQIGPIERSRSIGTLAYDPASGDYLVVSGEKKWYVLTASVTYFRGRPGDEVVVIIPKNAPSNWAAVENVIKKEEMRHIETGN